MFDRGVVVSHPFGELFGCRKRTVCRLRNVNASVARDLRIAFDEFNDSVGKRFFVDTALFEKLTGDTVFLIDESLQKMCLLKLLVAVFLSYALRIIYDFNAFLCKFLCVHDESPPAAFAALAYAAVLFQHIKYRSHLLIFITVGCVLYVNFSSRYI